MKSLTVFLAVILTVFTLTQPSQAAVGKIIGNKKVVTVGLAMTGAGVAIAAGGAAIVNATCQDLGCLAVLFPLMGGAIVGAAGLITLDGEQELQFQSLDRVSAKKIGVSEIERRTYNNEIDQANMLLSDVSVEISKLKDPSVLDAARLWEEVSSLVSPATFTTMQKIVSQQ